MEVTAHQIGLGWADCLVLDWYRLIHGSCLMVTAGGESGTKIVDAVAAADIVAAVVGAVAAEAA